jgi:hypothetical protein
MTENLQIKKVENFLKNDAVQSTIKISIFKTPNGEYELFDKYRIKQVDKKYVVEINNVFYQKIFYSLQNAVTYCIFENLNKFIESVRIHDLDKLVESLNFSISVLKSLISKSKDIESKMIYSGKLSQDEAKRTILLNELASYKQQANYWQSHKFKPISTKVVY